LDLREEVGSSAILIIFWLIPNKVREEGAEIEKNKGEGKGGGRRIARKGVEDKRS